MLEFLKVKSLFTNADVYRKVALNHQIIGELSRDSNQEYWRLTINGKYVTYKDSDVFSLTIARKAVMSYLKKGNT